MEFSARQIAEMVGGKVEGDSQAMVYNFSKIEEGQPGTLTFLVNLKYAPFIYKTKAMLALANDIYSKKKFHPP